MAQSIVNRVKELRTARGWTQEQLAQAVGVSRQSINSIERNRYVPSLELAADLRPYFFLPHRPDLPIGETIMTHPALSRILMLDHVADERFRQHQRRSTSAAAIVGTLTLFVMLEYRVLLEHRVPWDLLYVIYAMAPPKSPSCFGSVSKTEFISRSLSMCLSRRQLDPKSRRILQAVAICCSLPSGFARIAADEHRAIDVLRASASCLYRRPDGAGRRGLAIWSSCRTGRTRPQWRADVPCRRRNGPARSRGLLY